LVDEIDANLYVDNLFASAESTSKALEKCKVTKKIFLELNTNPREFMYNDFGSIAQISPEDRNSMKFQGRYAYHQQLSLKTTRTTKRTILSALAAVYDPMGWLTPLMLRTKQFFQYLYSKDYDWDTKLTPDGIRKWNAILMETKGISKELLRRVADKKGSHTLALFAARAPLQCALSCTSATTKTLVYSWQSQDCQR
uniref:Reverse transcriptase domain-containing protein n=1 Tax=Heligmosomoides polygyrus TaxID=6339 RepID=A0A183GFA2_HELPZ